MESVGQQVDTNRCRRIVNTLAVIGPTKVWELIEQSRLDDHRMLDPEAFVLSIGHRQSQNSLDKSTRGGKLFRGAVEDRADRCLIQAECSIRLGHYLSLG